MQLLRNLCKKGAEKAAYKGFSVFLFVLLFVAVPTQAFAYSTGNTTNSFFGAISNFIFHGNIPAGSQNISYQYQNSIDTPTPMQTAILEDPKNGSKGSNIVSALQAIQTNIGSLALQFTSVTKGFFNTVQNSVFEKKVLAAPNVIHYTHVVYSPTLTLPPIPKKNGQKGADIFKTIQKSVGNLTLGVTSFTSSFLNRVNTLLSLSNIAKTQQSVSYAQVLYTPTPTQIPRKNIQRENVLANIFHMLQKTIGSIAFQFSSLRSNLLAGLDHKTHSNTKILAQVVGSPINIKTVKASSTGIDILSALQKRISALEVQFSSFTPQQAVPGLTIDVAGGNLLRNSSFEAGGAGNIPSQWNPQYDSTSANTFISAEGIHSGNFGLKFLGGGTGNFGISQPSTKTTPQRTYTFSVYVKVVNASSTNFRLGFWDEYNNREGVFKNFSLSGTQDWRRISMTVTTPGVITNSTNYYPMILIQGLVSGNIYIDDAQLTEGSVLTDYNTALASTSSNSLSLGDGSILSSSNGNLYPAQSGVGQLGTSTNKWSALDLTNATIDSNGNLNLSGGLTVGGGLSSGVAHLNSSGGLTTSAIGLTTSDVTGTLGIGNGGTGVSSTPSNGQLLVGNGTGYTLATLTAGSNVTITNAAGSITIASTAGGGGTAFSSLTGGTNTSAAMVVGTGASLATSGTGTINANQLNGQTTSIGGALTTASSFTTSGAFALTLTTTGATNVTLPTSGTLSTFGGSFTNLTGGTNTTAAMLVGSGASLGGTGTGTITATGEDSNAAAGTLNIGTTNAGAINLGNSTNNTAVSIGGTTGTGTITLGQSTASNTVNIANANTTTGNTQTINIGAGTPAGTGLTTITIGNAVNTSSVTIQGAGASGINIGTAATAKTITIGTTGAVADTVNVLNTTTAGTINIGAGNAAHTIRLGDVQTGGSVAIGTSMTGGTVTIGGTSQTGNIILGQSTASNTISIGSATVGASNTQTINIGNGAGAGTAINVNILSGVGTAGTGTLTLGNNTRVTQIDVGNIAAAAARTLNVGTGANTVGIDTLNIGTGNTTVAGGKTIHIGDGTPSGSGTNLITIGSVANVASTTTIQGGNGTAAIALTPQTTGTIVIGASGGTGNITLGSSSGTETVLIGDGAGISNVNIANTTTAGTTVNIAGANTATGITDTINIGTGNTVGTGAKVVHIADGTPAGTNTVTIGSNANTANVTTIKGGNGAGAIALTPQTTGTIVIGAAAGTGAITLGSSTGSQTVNIGTGTGAGTVAIATDPTNGQTVNIVSGATATGKTDTINIGTGNTVGAKVIHIGDGTPTGTNTITIGSLANTANVTTIQGGNGTGAIALTPQTTGTIIIGATGGTGAITLGSSTGAQTVNIGTGTGAGTVAIATDPTNGQTVNIVSGATATGKTDTINIGTGNTVGTGAKVVHIADGTPAGTNTVTIGSNANTANVTTIQGGNGAGAIALTPQTTGTIVIGAAAGTGAITLGSSSTTQTTIIGGGAGVSTVQIAGGAGANVITIGNVQTGGSITMGNALTTGTIQIGGTSMTTGSTTINGGTGTGAITLTPGTAGTIVIGATAGTGAITLGSSTGAQTINIGTGAGGANNQVINIGTTASGSTGTTAINIGSSTAKVGINQATPLWRLHVTDTQNATASAMIENVAANNQAGHTGLIIRLGAANSATQATTNDRFINFMRGDSTIVGSINGNGSGAIQFNSNGVDFAEYFTKMQGINFEEGDVVSLGGQNDQVATKPTKAYDSSLLGIVSAHPAFTGGVSGSDKVLVGLVGQVPVKVSTENGTIQVGDALTSSATTPGVAMKATKQGPIIGKALESYNGSGLGKIMAYVNVSYANAPDAFAVSPATQGAAVLGTGTTNTATTQASSNLDLSVLNKLTATDSGLTVNSSVEFKGQSIFDEIVSFITNVIFKGDVAFLGRPTFNSDTAGRAVIKKGANAVYVSFQREYDQLPEVNISITLSKMDDQNAQASIEQSILTGDVKYIVTSQTTKGFVIELNKVAPNDITFSWIAIAVKDATVNTSPASNSSLGNTSTTQSNPQPSPTDTVTPTPENVTLTVTPSISPTVSIAPAVSSIVSPTPTLSPTPSLMPSPTVVPTLSVTPSLP